jgi:hypothetical protein
MAIQVQLRRGTTAQNDGFTGVVGEVTVDTEVDTLRVHDGVTAGGATVVTLSATQTLTNKTLTSPTITSPTVTGGGSITITGNIAGGNLIATTAVETSTLTATANVTGGNLVTGAQVVATGNITGGNIITAGLITATGNVSSTANVNGNNVIATTSMSLPEITKTGSNGVGNIGSASSYFDTVFAKATSAEYADLAEVYESDAIYEPGTVMIFGGDREVTQCDTAIDTRVAGVISTDPSFVMNTGCSSSTTATVALLGKVPVKVSGVVRKGDIMVSAGGGRAQSATGLAHIPTGSVLGKSLENFAGGDGVIQIVVGRL